jgi:hypothetical protein
MSADALGLSGDARRLANDPQVGRSRRKPIHRGLDVARRRLGRPPFADPPDLAATLELFEASECFVVVETGSPRDHRGREWATHLFQRDAHAVRALFGPTLVVRRRRRRVGHRFGRSALRIRSRCARTRRCVSEAGVTTPAQDDGLRLPGADDVKPSPSATGATNAAAPTGTFNFDQIIVGHRHPPTTIEGRAPDRLHGASDDRPAAPGGRRDPGLLRP